MPARAFKKAIEESDALLFVTPEYNRGIPGSLKNAIDWGSRPKGNNAFAHKPSAVIGTSAGKIGTAVAQRELHSVLGAVASPQMVSPGGLRAVHAGPDRRRGQDRGPEDRGVPREVPRRVPEVPRQAARVIGLADKLSEFRAGITAIDVDYVRPKLAASHLVVDGGRAAFVDTGTTHSLATLLYALEAKGIGRGDVDWVLTTHVHLDHAGGAGALMRELPNARCAVHPRGARHLAEPSKLIAGSMAVYGEERYRALYGEILPIDAARIFEAADGARIRLGGRELELIHTPGHALHHYCIVDAANALIFSGDTFGISYRDFDVDGRAFIFPTTTPVHFDPDALCRSVDRLMSYRPRSIFLTHYAEVTRARQARARDEGAGSGLRRPGRALPGRAGPRGQASPRHVCDDGDLARRAPVSAGRCQAALAAGRRHRTQLPGHRELAGQDLT